MPIAEPGFNTLALHAGTQPASLSSGQGCAPDPQTMLEDRISALEGGTAAVAVASARAARLCVVHALMRPGDTILVAEDADEALFDDLSAIAEAFAGAIVRVAAGDPDAVDRLIDGRTRAIFVESLSSANGAFADIVSLGAIAQARGLPLIVDNTTATPYLTRPIEYGADAVIHGLSGLAADDRAPGGLVVDGGTFDWVQFGVDPKRVDASRENGVQSQRTFSNRALAEACRAASRRVFETPMRDSSAALALAGLETMPLRLQRHCDNAAAVAAWLAGRDGVDHVTHPSLPGDANHEAMRRHAPNGGGAMVGFRIRGGSEATKKVLAALDLIAHDSDPDCQGSASRSRIVRPRSNGDADASDGVPRIRLFVGLEAIDDIMADLRRALACT